MKKWITASLLSLFATQSFATVDGHDKVFLVVKDIQSEEFFVERAPIIGCYGPARGPHLVQFTAEYKVNSNVGCSNGQTFQDNINYLTCAKVIEAKESADFMSYSEIVLDISQCKDKNNTKLETMIRTAAKLNFPQTVKGKPTKQEVKLIIKK